MPNANVQSSVQLMVVMMVDLFQAKEAAKPSQPQHSAEAVQGF